MDVPTPQRCVMIIAGEASGDLHGAALVSAMRQRDPSLFFCGIGGDRLRAVGVRVAVDAASLAVVGITEVVSKMPALFRGLRAAKQMLRTLRPDLLVLIDFPDFNLHVAGVAKKLGIPVLYYISPQIWAWRQGRVRKIGTLVDHMAVILPFEAAFYQQHHIPVTFVGHPLLDRVPGPVQRRETAGRGPVIGLLPGSRNREVARLLPPLLAAARLLRARRPDLRFVLSQAPSVDKDRLQRLMASFADLDIKPDPRPVAEIFQQVDLVLAASGTVTLEAAIAGVPAVIVYRVSMLSYWMGRALIRVRHIGLANLIAGRTVVPELIQAQASAPRIADTAAAILEDPAGLDRLHRDLAGVRDLLGGPGASQRVAGIAMDMMENDETDSTT
ncbi:MAG: lipid-A-disaccharide synthase [Desulfobacterales bacterium]|nr:lipid-A-disaccharide synthase [Desulfobacterales bacterium]